MDNSQRQGVAMTYLQIEMPQAGPGKAARRESRRESRPQGVITDYKMTMNHLILKSTKGIVQGVSMDASEIL
jgi:hypothetical protein